MKKALLVLTDWNTQTPPLLVALALPSIWVCKKGKFHITQTILVVLISSSFKKSLFVILLLPDNWKLIHITSGKYFLCSGENVGRCLSLWWISQPFEINNGQKISMTTAVCIVKIRAGGEKVKRSVLVVRGWQIKRTLVGRLDSWAPTDDVP